MRPFSIWSRNARTRRRRTAPSTRTGESLLGSDDDEDMASKDKKPAQLAKAAPNSAAASPEDTGPTLPAPLPSDALADMSSSTPPPKVSTVSPSPLPSPSPSPVVAEPSSKADSPTSTPPPANNNNNNAPPKASSPAPAPVLPSQTMAPLASPSRYELSPAEATSPPSQQTGAAQPLGSLLSLVPPPLLTPLSTLLALPPSLLSAILPPSSSPSFETIRRPISPVFATASNPSPSDTSANVESNSTAPNKYGNSSAVITGVVLALLFTFLALMLLRPKFMKRRQKRQVEDRLSWLVKGNRSPDSSFEGDEGKGGEKRELGSPFAMDDISGRSNWVTFPTEAVYAQSSPLDTWHSSQNLKSTTPSAPNYPPLHHPTSPQFSDSASMHLSLSPRNIASYPPPVVPSPVMTNGTAISGLYSPRSWATILSSPKESGGVERETPRSVGNFIGRLSPFGNKMHAREDSLEVMQQDGEGDGGETTDDDASVYSCATVTGGFSLPGGVGGGGEIDLERSRRGDLEQPFPTTPTEDGVEVFR